MADGTVVIETDLDSSGIEKGMKKTSTSLKSQAASLAAEYKKQGMSASDAWKKAWQDVERESQGATQRIIGDLGNIATKGLSIATKAVTAIGTALIGVGGAAVKVGMDFESSMSQVAATMGITVDEIANGSEAFELLENAAKEAGATTQFSASQSAEALNYLALAGYDASEAAGALPTVLNLAAAGGLDLAYASDLVTDSMSALGLEMTDLDGFVDQLAKTSQKSNTSVKFDLPTLNRTISVKPKIGIDKKVETTLKLEEFYQSR